MSVFSSLLKPLAYLSLPVFALHALSNSSSPVTRYYARLTLYLSTMGLCSVWGAIVAVVMSLTGNAHDVNFVTARSFYNLAGRILGIDFKVEGEEYLDTRPAILVGNHQSMVDILYLGRIFPKQASIMAKKELQWMPLLGQYMSLSGAVFVDRGNNAKAVRSLTAAGETIKGRRTSLWMFPEGTRSMRAYPDMLPFKKGAFHMAVEAQIPIVPVVCENYWRLYRKGVFDSGTLKIKVLPPISTVGLTNADVGSLAARVREEMVKALKEISEPVSPPASSDQPVIDTPPVSTPVVSEEQKEPLSSLPSFTAAGPDISPIQVAPSSRSESRASTHASDLSSPSVQHGGSEAGAETEEDEGMVLVDRPRP